MNKKIYTLLLIFLFSLTLMSEVKAQLTISGQLRTRTELRDGQGTPAVQDTVPALFTSQRTRINFGYSGYRFKVYTSIQDARVWGQDASTVNRTTTDANDGLMLHEAWGEFSLVDTGRVIKNFTVKIGRQELVYDDSRLLGNLDWLQQARRHDAVLVKFDHAGWMAHVGAAFNQNAERKSNTIYNGVPAGYVPGTNGVGTMYKSMQFIYLSKKLFFGSASLLAVKDDFSKFHYAPADIAKVTPIYEQAVWSRYTVGAYAVGTAFRKISFTASAYYQGGHFREGTKLNEYLISLSTLYAAGRKVSVGPGVDITSGNNGSDPTQRYQRFDPLYGTPHKFWGYMDYFYVADGFGPSGLVDYYLKTRYKPKEKITLTLDAHQFVLPQAVLNETGNTLGKTLGTELDLVGNYTLTKQITIEGGYSSMFSTTTMLATKVKNVKNNDTFSSWAYLMISIKPEFILK
jgi:hypothetical protein